MKQTLLWFKTKMTYQQLFRSISSAPRCKYLSGNLFTISSNKAFKNSKVESDVGSMGPKIPVSFPLYSQGIKSPGWPNSHDFVWPGVSNSGITLIPLILASSMILLKLKFAKLKLRPFKFLQVYRCIHSGLELWFREKKSSWHMTFTQSWYHI